MEINDLKPDFKKISFAQNRDESTYYSLEETWKKIVNGEYSYDKKTNNIFNVLYEEYNLKENENFRALLKEFNLEGYFKDLLFLAHFSKGRMELDLNIKSFNKLFPWDKNEDIKALKLLYDIELPYLEIIIKHKNEKLSSSINDYYLIKKIRDAIQDFFIENEMDFKSGAILPEEVKNWKGLIDYYYDKAIKNEIKPKKGRREKPRYTGLEIEILQRYLQKYTELKSENDASISNRQASFIFKYLDVFDLIPEEFIWKKGDGMWKEDNIRHLLKKYKASKEFDVPKDLKILMEEYNNNFKAIKAKLTEINKKK